jgi:polyisoprenoid-binding protein YceI
VTTARIGIGTWTIDATHSTAEFEVRHMLVSTVTGRFRSLEGTLSIDEANPTNSSVTAAIDVSSIDAGEPQRDAHLRSDDFFNAERYPAIPFRSTRVEQLADEHWTVVGGLTIRDVTREVVLDTDWPLVLTDSYGNQRAGFSAETAINRREFGLKWNALLASGGAAVVGDRVRITLHIEAVRQPVAQVPILPSR